MPRRAGRRRLENNGKTSPAGSPPTTADAIYGPPNELTPTQEAFSSLHPVDRSQITCRLCRLIVVEIPHHLEVKHPNISVEDYLGEFPGAPLRPSEQEREEPRPVNQKVSKSEEEEHPGGRHGVLMERELDRAERRGFREDLDALRARGYPINSQLASLAYYQTLQRRLIREIEEIRRTASGRVSSAEKLKLLREIGQDIQRMISDFDKAKALEREQGDALNIIEQELVEAEAWIQQHTGEFDMSCPNCHIPLTAPGLPDWAFEPLVIDSEHGKQTIYPVWSTEMWKLVLDRKISLYMMAFILRTSPEGLKYTCGRRKEEWPEWINIADEERELGLLIKQEEDAWRVRNATIVAPPIVKIDPPPAPPIHVEDEERF
jgi:hypothetical protein